MKSSLPHYHSQLPLDRDKAYVPGLSTMRLHLSMGLCMVAGLQPVLLDLRVCLLLRHAPQARGDDPQA